MSPAPDVEVRRDRTGEALYAARPFAPGETVFSFADAERRPQREQHTLQHPGGGHLLHPVLAKTAHSCAPNARVAFPEMAMVAVRAIHAGEPVTFDYATTESAFSRPFDCLCGAPSCRGRIG